MLGRDRAELSALHVAERLLDLVHAVHHEWPILHDGLVDRLSGQENDVILFNNHTCHHRTPAAAVAANDPDRWTVRMACCHDLEGAAKTKVRIIRATIDPGVSA